MNHYCEYLFNIIYNLNIIALACILAFLNRNRNRVYKIPSSYELFNW